MTPYRRRFAPPSKQKDHLAARLFGVLGQLLATAAILLVLFLLYTLWWTNIDARKQATVTAQAIRSGWSQSGGTGGERNTNLPGIGFLHVPALGPSAAEIAIVKGTDPKRLNEGVAGYYTTPVPSAMPWDKEGNFTLAAHRDGHGAKFHKLDKVGIGDPIVVETAEKWYVYKVFSTLQKTTAADVNTIEPIPTRSGRHTRGRYITLTTCTPVLTSDYRLIVWGEITRVERVDHKRTPPLELRQR